MSEFQIDVAACRMRQQRLLAEMPQLGVDAVVVTANEHVQWLTGPRFPWVFQSAAVLLADGTCTLIAPQEEPDHSATDKVATYEAKWHSTMRNDQAATCHGILWDVVGPRLSGARVGIEYSGGGHYWGEKVEATIDVDPLLYRLRRRKDQDELALLRKAIAGTEKMYARARQMIEPGISELEVFNQLQAAAVEEFGEMLTGTGNDYRCAARGGPPREGHRAAAGDLYILDLGPAFRGYFADNARTIAVTEPTELQQEAWQHVTGALAYVQENARPGKNAKALFEEVSDLLEQSPVGVFNHHLGHGIGLFPHEAPHLNPHWNDTLEVGDVFTAEPGLYAAELQAGMRIENDYLVTEDGVELLTDFDLRL